MSDLHVHRYPQKETKRQMINRFRQEAEISEIPFNVLVQKIEQFLHFYCERKSSERMSIDDVEDIFENPPIFDEYKLKHPLRLMASFSFICKEFMEYERKQNSEAVGNHAGPGKRGPGGASAAVRRNSSGSPSTSSARQIRSSRSSELNSELQDNRRTKLSRRFEQERCLISWLRFFGKRAGAKKQSSLAPAEFRTALLYSCAKLDVPPWNKMDIAVIYGFLSNDQRRDGIMTFDIKLAVRKVFLSPKKAAYLNKSAMMMRILAEFMGRNCTALRTYSPACMANPEKTALNMEQLVSALCTLAIEFHIYCQTEGIHKFRTGGAVAGYSRTRAGPAAVASSSAVSASVSRVGGGESGGERASTRGRSRSRHGKRRQQSEQLGAGSTGREYAAPEAVLHTVFSADSADSQQEGGGSRSRSFDDGDTFESSLHTAHSTDTLDSLQSLDSQSSVNKATVSSRQRARARVILREEEAFGAYGVHTHNVHAREMSELRERILLSRGGSANNNSKSNSNSRGHSRAGSLSGALQGLSSSGLLHTQLSPLSEAVTSRAAAAATTEGSEHASSSRKLPEGGRPSLPALTHSEIAITARNTGGVARRHTLDAANPAPRRPAPIHPRRPTFGNTDPHLVASRAGGGGAERGERVVARVGTSRDKTRDRDRVRGRTAGGIDGMRGSKGAAEGALSAQSSVLTHATSSSTVDGGAGLGGATGTGIGAGTGLTMADRETIANYKNVINSFDARISAANRRMRYATTNTAN